MPGVQSEPDLCMCPECTELLPLSSPSPDHYSSFKWKQRESTVTLGIGDYADVEVPAHLCQYQHLDLSQLEENVYHTLHGNHETPAREKTESQRSD